VVVGAGAVVDVVVVLATATGLGADAAGIECQTATPKVVVAAARTTRKCLHEGARSVTAIPCSRADELRCCYQCCERVTRMRADLGF
jgi:hypothetical protein